MKPLKLLAVIITAITTSVCSAQTGYKGMIEAGRTFHLTYTPLHTTEVATTHGYQFNNYLYVGAGVGLNFNSSEKKSLYMPMYLDVKANLLRSKVTPFIDLKAGYSVLDVKGVYLSPSIGVDYNFYRKLSVYLKVGYTYQKAQCQMHVGNNETKDYIGGITAKAGFCF